MQKAAAGNLRKLRTYSSAPVRISSLRRRQLGGVEPHQRGEGLRHPVGDHRHGAEHDADLQQRHRHLCALLGLFFKPSSFYRLQRETTEASHGRDGAQSCSCLILMLHPGLRLRGSFFGHLLQVKSWRRRTRVGHGGREKRPESGGGKKRRRGGGWMNGWMDGERAQTAAAAPVRKKRAG